MGLGAPSEPEHVTAFFKLIIEDDEGKTTVYPLAEEPVSIGRREDNIVRLMERNVSRCHARLSQQAGGVFIEDLDSYNGVRVNGERIQGELEFREGDLVEIGDYHLALQRAEPAQASPEAARAEPPPPLAFADEAASFGLPLPPFPSQTELLAPSELPQLPSGEATLLPGPSERSSVARLICVSTEYAGQEFALTQPEIVIGRVDDNDIVIEHRSVSRNHAKILFDGDSHKIIDLQSANGVLVNGEEYAMTDLRQGDHIEFGHVHFRFVPAGELYAPTAEEAEAMHAAGVEPPASVALAPVHPTDFTQNEAPTEVYPVDSSRAETVTQASAPPTELPSAEPAPSAAAVIEAPITITEARALPEASASVVEDGFRAQKASPKIVLLVGVLVCLVALSLAVMLWLRKNDSFEREITRLKAEQNYAALVEYLDRQDPAAEGVPALRAQAAALLEAQQRFEACSRRAPTPECKLDFARALQQAEEFKAAKAQLQQALREAGDGPLQGEIKRRLQALSGG